MSLIKITSYEGNSWGSYIDKGYSIIEADDLIPITKLGNFDDGLLLEDIFKKLGHEVELRFVRNNENFNNFLGDVK